LCDYLNELHKIITNGFRIENHEKLDFNLQNSLTWPQFHITNRTQME